MRKALDLLLVVKKKNQNNVQNFQKAGQKWDARRDGSLKIGTDIKS